MRSGFSRGLLIGGLIGASISMLTNSGGMKSRRNRHFLRAGRNFLRKSGNVVEDVVELLRQ